MREIKGKVVHNEKIDDYLLVVTAKYENETATKIKEEWFEGRVVVECCVYDKNNSLIASYDNKSDNYDYPYHIGFKRKYERYGFMKLRKREYMVHISDEYERVLPLLLESSRGIARKLVEKETKKNLAQYMTDGLPDSLKNL